jgi:hypothetical protein
VIARARRLVAGVLLTLSVPAAPAQALQAGAATVALRVPPGTPLAGYGSSARRLLVPDVLGRHPHAFWFKPAAGELDPLVARALVLEDGATRLIWLTADLVAVDRELTEAVAARLKSVGLGPSALIVSASHTHSGPGAFLDSRLVGFLSLDRYDEAVRAALVESLVEAGRRAGEARSPALMGVAGLAAPPLTASRLGQALDPGIVILKVVTTGGRPLALVWNYAIHGTMLGPKNLRLSGDVMGVASRRLERAIAAPALFVNGAVADVSPRRHGEAAAQEDGGRLADAVRAAWAGATVAPGAPLAVRSTTVRLPSPTLSVRNCAGRWLPRSLRLPLESVLPAHATLTAATLGPAAWVTIPGELQTSLGQVLKRAGERAGKRTFVAGLSNDYLGYFLSGADYDRVTYIACASLYGPTAGERLTRAAADLLDSVAVRGERQLGGASRAGR